MGEVQKVCGVLIVCGLLFAFGSCSEEETKKPSFSERLAGLLYVSSPTPSSSSSSSSSSSIPSYWEKLKAHVNQGRAYFFPPNLEGSEENEAVGVTGSEAGAGEKVKSAAARSVEKGKEAVAGSARLAAEMAGETVQKTKEKVKRSLSSREAQEL